MEIVHFIGAFLLLVGLIYSTLNWHYRDERRDRIAARASATGTNTTLMQELALVSRRREDRTLCEFYFAIVRNVRLAHTFPDLPAE